MGCDCLFRIPDQVQLKREGNFLICCDLTLPVWTLGCHREQNMEGEIVPSRGLLTMEQHVFAEGGPGKFAGGQLAVTLPLLVKWSAGL